MIRPDGEAVVGWVAQIGRALRAFKTCAKPVKAGDELRCWFGALRSLLHSRRAGRNGGGRFDWPFAQSRLRHQFFYLSDLDRDERRKIFITVLGNQDHVFKTYAEMQLGDRHRRFDGEELAGFERLGRQSHVVNFHPDGVAQAVRSARAVAFDEARGRVFDLRVGELIACQNRIHLDDGVFDDVARRGVDFDRSHQRLIEPQIDRVILALPRRELAVGGKDACHVRNVILVIGRVVELHQIAVLQPGGVFVVVRVERVAARSDQREVGRSLRAMLFEDEFGWGLQLILEHSRPGLAHRFHNAEAGDARGFADDSDFAQALERAHRVEDRIEVLHVDLWRKRFDLLNEDLFA